MNSQKKFAVVIVTYNRKKLLMECIEAILKEKVPINYIIIVDNGSTDGTNSILYKYKGNSRFIIRCEDKNRGGAYGFYQGIKISLDLEWEWLIIIDDDAILDNNFTERIQEAIAKYPENKAFSGKVLTQGEIAKEHRARNFLKLIYKPFPAKEKEYNKESFEYELSSFCGLVIHRNVIEKVGLPLKEFFIRNDDFEYSLRIGKYTKIRNINNAIINHKTVISTREKDFSWKLFYNMRNAIYISGKHYGIVAKIEISIRYILGMILNIIRYGILRKKSIVDIIKVYRDAILSGIKDETGFDCRYHSGKN